MCARFFNLFYVCTLLFVSMFCISNVFAETAYLLTSLKLSDSEKKYIENQFFDSFKKAPYNLIVKHDVGPSVLVQVLEDPEASAIIWVSHAAHSQSKGNSVVSDDIVLDYWGNDVKKFFTKLPSKLKFLGIVGCNAKSLFEGYKNKGYFKNHEWLKIESFDEKITLKNGLNKTLKSATKYLSEEHSVNPEVNNDDKVVEIEYRAYGYGSGWIEFDDHIVGFFSIEDGKTVFPQISIPLDDWQKSKTKNLKYFRNKEYLYHNIDNIKFETVKGPKAEWRLFKNSNGKALGGNEQRLFIYQNLP